MRGAEVSRRTKKRVRRSQKRGAPDRRRHRTKERGGTPPRGPRHPEEPARQRALRGLAGHPGEAAAGDLPSGPRPPDPRRCATLQEAKRRLAAAASKSAGKGKNQKKARWTPRGREGEDRRPSPCVLEVPVVIGWQLDEGSSRAQKRRAYRKQRKGCNAASFKGEQKSDQDRAPSRVPGGRQRSCSSDGC